MGLIHWWPLNGNTNDYGLNSSNGSLVGNASVTSTNGKIGKCLTAGDGTQTTAGIQINSNLVDELSNTDYSFTVWVKINGNHVHYEGAIISSGNWNSSCWAFGIKQDNSAINPAGDWYNGDYISYQFSTGIWYHIASVQKDNTNYVYVNGELVGSIGHNPIYRSDASTTFIGRESYAGGYFSFNGNINDLRIYNHALSDKEVKEISKACILHYDFEDPEIEPTINLCNSITPAQYSGWGTITFSQLDINAYRIKNSAYDSSSLSVWSSWGYDLSSYIGQTITFSATIKNLELFNTVDSSCWIAIGQANNGTYPNHIESSGEGNYILYSGNAASNKRLTWTGVLQQQGRALIEVWTTANASNGYVQFDLCDIQIEVKDHATPYVNGSRPKNLVKEPVENSSVGFTIDSTHPLNDWVVYKCTQSGNTSPVYKTMVYQDFSSILKPGSTVTLSAYFYTENKSLFDGYTGSEFRIYRTFSDNSTSYSGIDWSGSHRDNEWIRYSKTYTIESNTTGAYLNLDIVKNGTFWMTGLQVEYGEIATSFEGYSNSTYGVIDNSGFGYDSRVFGNLQISSDSAIGLHSAKFDGSSTKIISPFDNPYFGNDFTISAWLKSNVNNGGYLTAFGNEVSNGGIVFGELTATNKLECYLNGTNGADINICAYNSFNANTWYHVVYTVKNALSAPDASLYIDGALVSHVTGSAPFGEPSGNLLYIGCNKTYRYWNGNIADFKIYATALSAADVLKEYQSKFSLDKDYNMNAKGSIVEFGENIAERANADIQRKVSNGDYAYMSCISLTDYNTNYPANDGSDLATYVQGNLSCTLTDDGFRIYSAPNINNADNGGSNSMWGGLCWSPFRFNKTAIQKGHRYLLKWHMKGKSSRAMSEIYWTNQIGWRSLSKCVSNNKCNAKTTC